MISRAACGPRSVVCPPVVHKIIGLNLSTGLRNMQVSLMAKCKNDLNYQIYKTLYHLPKTLELGLWLWLFSAFSVSTHIGFWLF